MSVAGPVTPTLAHIPINQDLKSRLAGIEQRSGGRLGVAVLYTGTGKLVTHRGDERFPMCSTFKASTTALVLQRVDQGFEQQDRRIIIHEKDLLQYAPVAKLHVGGEGLSITELCVAAMTVSDNTAANLLVASCGGPSAITRFWRSIGDVDSRLDRIEPDLNEGKPGDPRDTTTPTAMLEDLHKFVFGNVLKPKSRAQFTKWLLENKTGAPRLRAGLPRDWKVGDKTGSGHKTTNDIAVLWPPNRKPILVTAYLTNASESNSHRDAILAEVGHAIANSI